MILVQYHYILPSENKMNVTCRISNELQTLILFSHISLLLCHTLMVIPSLIIPYDQMTNINHHPKYRVISLHSPIKLDHAVANLPYHCTEVHLIGL